MKLWAAMIGKLPEAAHIGEVNLVPAYYPPQTESLLAPSNCKRDMIYA
jgi:hypothetical protein